MSEEIKLTQYSRGAGCGCKIAPKALETILKDAWVDGKTFPSLLVGNQSKDDAAVYDLGNGTSLVATTDFFMPIVDDPYDFGRIAAANAISDVYAMGGKPLVALAILGWPVEQLPLEWATKIIEGGRSVCAEVGIPLAGGHSVDTTEPLFGLSVNGLVSNKHLKQNNSVKEGDLLFITKPLGVGVLTTAMKRGLLQSEHKALLLDTLTTVNTIGYELGQLDGVTAMTDVTGFGILGHLTEMAEGSGLTAHLQYSKLPLIAGVSDYIKQRIFPDATSRNWSSYSAGVRFEKGVNVMEAFTLLPDPQTNGGILFSVRPDSVETVIDVLKSNGLSDFCSPIGSFVQAGEKRIEVLI